ncbi:hypothetical protein KGM_212470 [Danaus plexippus plexippus]|uniref:Uncharacterized protein n=1 Tax=Danaus plexippus plexippus TaxID=278856 RepID=A0A212F997_DANPL|nr:hypothetical protein KGM_212470 [Danaus plexippus plexippus]
MEIREEIDGECPNDMNQEQEWQRRCCEREHRNKTLTKKIDIKKNVHRV